MEKKQERKKKIKKQKQEIVESKETSDIKYCPSCQHPTMKIGGCNRVRCVCKTKWCWICNLQKARKDKPIESQGKVCNDASHKSH